MKHSFSHLPRTLSDDQWERMTHAPRRTAERRIPGDDPTARVDRRLIDGWHRAFEKAGALRRR